MNEMSRSAMKFILFLIAVMEYNTLEVSSLFPIGLDIRLPNLLNLHEDRRSTSTTVDIIKQFGYPAETHTVTTQDGYILELHRIPRGIKFKDGPHTPVLIGHGLLSSSTDFVVNFPHQSLGYLLADAGYDVWLCNFRGNTYGRRHTTLNPDRDLEFWQFTWDQMSQYDLPEHINYVLNYTKYEQLYYIGHSMGTTAVLSMLSTKTEYNNKIKLFQALAPAARISHAKSKLFLLSPLVNNFKSLFLLLGSGEFQPSKTFMNILGQHCDDAIEIVCKNVVFLINGYNRKELNMSRLDVYFSSAPAGSSTMTIIQMFQEEPPLYDLQRVTVPVIIYWGQNDLLCDPQDVAFLKSQLPNLKEYIQVGDEDWSHTDFIWAINANRLLYDPMIQRMPRF